LHDHVSLFLQEQQNVIVLKQDHSPPSQETFKLLNVIITLSIKHI